MELKLLLALVLEKVYNIIVMNLNSISDNVKCFKKLALAVSGGRDSMAMMNWFAEHRREFDRLVVVNVEHGIRGESSISDSLFVENKAKALDLEFVGYKENIPLFCKQNGYTLEQGARIRRREIFRSLVESGEVERVVTAHYKSDQAESVLMHVFRGSGLGGLRGIRIDDGYLLRPMLDITAEELNNYVKDNKIQFVTDETNNSEIYTRNKLRLDIIPRIKTVYPAMENNVCKVAKCADEAYSFIWALLPPISVENGCVVIPIDLIQKRDILAKFAIFKGLDLLGKRVDIEETHISAILDLANKQRGSVIHLPHSLKAYKEKDIVLAQEIEIKNEEYDFALGSFEVNGFKFNINTDSGHLKFDLGKIKGARIRVRKDGDKFKSFMGGTKSLVDYLTDKKVEKRIKDCMPVIAVEDEILIIPTLEISDKVKIDERTKNVGYIRLVEK